MLLTPTELERLTLYSAAELSRKRRAKGLRLNFPEASALIADEILEGAREGRSVAELIGFGSTILSTDDVLPGVADLLPVLQVEGTFPDGTKLVTVHQPIRPGRLALASLPTPGEIISPEGDIQLSSGRPTATLRALNTGDRPVQVGSHYHFFEVNKALDFPREIAFGMHLDIPAGTAVRFEPGELREVRLVQFGGSGDIHGFSGLTNGNLHDPACKAAALQRARAQQFKGA
ncbi:TPA: urease subunit beta [Pseudomonas aeruginosa]|jgi:urease subunit gamma/beta|uniref:urease subunit beta n=1 Tax=Pseudomonadaceae TaxID=135621 RepID=UPI0007445F2F|nr:MULTISPECIES: urease subunit beta [Pseudomonas]ALY66752.1 Urease subunit alpha [Pseudomonas aeruginosa]AYW42374.1 urease subunit beta [Pseudomonas aeruginosa]MDH1680993.1 urease subunit beta [Pseudomonas chengduensis]MDH2199408.1 urease subunit beta [Pseudomonas oleovorans]RQA18627.1 Urease subunit alpha [Pseudomonas aeruginosa]